MIFDFPISFKIPVKALALFFALAFPSIANGQTNEANLGYAEELFVQTDRDIYFTGEEVLLKVNKFNRLSKTQGDFSKVAYVDLLDDFGNPRAQVKVGIDGFSGSAGFRLPDTLRTGNYFVRGYTGWMRNFPTEYFAYKQITVINPFEDISRFKVRSSALPDTVLFYPEAGSLVGGLTTKVGFTALSVNGDPVAFEGYIYGEGTDTLAVVSDINGYGMVTVGPDAKSTPYLVCTDEQGNAVKAFRFPALSVSGASFTVGQENNGISVNLLSKGMDNSVATLEYNSGGFISTKKRVALATGERVLFQNGEIPYGPAVITLTDAAGKILASRWVYNKKATSASFDIKISGEKFTTREMVALTVGIPEELGNISSQNVSVSVVKSLLADDNPLREQTRDNQSPLPGTIGAAQKFWETNDYLIFLGGKQGSAFSFDLSTALHAPELEGNVISGVIRDRESNLPLKNINIILSFVGPTAHCKFSKTDTSGVFNFVVKDKGLREVVIAPLSSTITDYYVELNDPFEISGQKYSNAPFYLDSSRLDGLNEAIIGMQVRNIYFPYTPVDSAKTPETKEINFYGEPDNVVYIDEFIELTTVDEIIKEILPDVWTQKRNKKTNLKLNNKYPTGEFTKPPLVLFDGVPLKDIDEIIDVPAREIERVDVFNTRYFISDIVMDGIIHFISKKGDLSMMEFDKSVFRQVYHGVDDSGGNYYFPAYGTEAEKNSRVPDYRNTLYWDPFAEIGEDNRIDVEFYTSDEVGDYTVIVEGFSTDGTYIRSTGSFSVER